MGVKYMSQAQNVRVCLYRRHNSRVRREGQKESVPMLSRGQEIEVRNDLRTIIVEEIKRGPLDEQVLIDSVRLLAQHQFRRAGPAVRSFCYSEIENLVPGMLKKKFQELRREEEREKKRSSVLC